MIYLFEMIGEISSYITKRYQYWKDYARYHASLTGIPDLAEDLLHEVVINLINKDPDQLRRLYERRKGQYREIDFYCLHLIKRNAHSLTSPFRYHVVDRVPKDSNADPWSLEILDRDYDPEEDPAGRILELIRLVRVAIDWTYLPVEERLVCEMVYLGDAMVTEAAKCFGISYTRAREARCRGTMKIKETLDDIQALRRIHQN